MCKFFSVVSDGKGTPYYFDWKLRCKVLSGELKDYQPDSHTSIADYFGFKGEKEDKLNKYEYNPLLKTFVVDQMNTTDDAKKIEKFCKQLDFKTVIEPLIIKPIVHPFKIKPPKISPKEIALVKGWDSVRDSVWASVRDSVWDSVGASVWASVRDSVRDSVWASVRDSVRDSVWASVWASVGAYTSSFFQLDQWKYVKHEKGKNPFQPCIDLWEMGLVPSFDGKVWRLHGGKDAKILWEGKV